MDYCVLERTHTGTLLVESTHTETLWSGAIRTGILWAEAKHWNIVNKEHLNPEYCKQKMAHNWSFVSRATHTVTLLAEATHNYTGTVWAGATHAGTILLQATHTGTLLSRTTLTGLRWAGRLTREPCQQVQIQKRCEDGNSSWNIVIRSDLYWKMVSTSDSYWKLVTKRELILEHCDHCGSFHCELVRLILEDFDQKRTHVGTSAAKINVLNWDDRLINEMKILINDVSPLHVQLLVLM